MRAKKLTIYDFDNFENHIGNAVYLRELRVFIDNDNETAHKKISDYLKSFVETPYLGWDGKVYPIFKVEDGEVF